MKGEEMKEIIEEEKSLKFKVIVGDIGGKNESFYIIVD